MRAVSGWGLDCVKWSISFPWGLFWGPISLPMYVSPHKKSVRSLTYPLSTDTMQRRQGEEAKSPSPPTPNLPPSLSAVSFLVVLLLTLPQQREYSQPDILKTDSPTALSNLESEQSKRLAQSTEFMTSFKKIWKNKKPSSLRWCQVLFLDW